MDYKDLNNDERLLLVALLDATIKADSQYSDEEATEVDRIAEAMGPARYRSAVEEARKRLPTLESIQQLALTIQRPEARELILTAVQDMAVVDEVSPEEMHLVDWLAAQWDF